MVLLTNHECRAQSCVSRGANQHLHSAVDPAHDVHVHCASLGISVEDRGLH